MNHLLAGAVSVCLLFAGCGDEPGYSFGVYDEQVAELAPLADRYCARADFCQVRPFGILGGDYDSCRLWLSVNIVDDVQRSEACESAWIAVVECVEASPCIDFPAFGDAGTCAGLSDSAVNDCIAVRP